MGERADLKWCSAHQASTPSNTEHCWFALAKSIGRRPTDVGPCQLDGSAALSVLLPDVDWEALRRASDRFPEGDMETLLGLAADVLAVYDGKDG